eukprot:scaffold15612_cov105-Amphora_coffeaeformis.AAC.1
MDNNSGCYHPVLAIVSPSLWEVLPPRLGDRLAFFVGAGGTRNSSVDTVVCFRGGVEAFGEDDKNDFSTSLSCPSHQEMCFLPSSVNNNNTQPEIALFGSGDKTHPNMEGHWLIACLLASVIESASTFTPPPLCSLWYYHYDQQQHLRKPKWHRVYRQRATCSN